MIHFDGAFFIDEDPLGSGLDGTIVVNSGVVDVSDIYENDNVTGVTTWRGINKGLFKGAGTYIPNSNQYINRATSVPNCVDFIISPSAVLRATPWNGSDSTRGAAWVACTNAFINSGTISLTGCGGAGGGCIGQGAGGNYAASAIGIGAGGNGANNANGNTGGTGGIIYGVSAITPTTWNYLYGSGGGGGGGGGNGMTPSSNATSGTTAQAGGGILRVYALTFCTTGGIISVNGGMGGVGGNGGDTPSIGPGAQGAGGGGGAGYAAVGGKGGNGGGLGGAGGGGGGNGAGGGGGGGSGASGGSIYIYTTGIALLGINRMTATGGSGGAGGPPGTGSGGVLALPGAAGTGGSMGRIHVVGSYSGSTNSPAIG